MIHDALPNFGTYAGVHRLFPVVLDYLLGQDLGGLASGRHPIANGAYAISSSYRTITPGETFIECHRKYIDIQVMVAGAERIGLCLTGDVEELAYNEEQDFQTLRGDLQFITLHQGCFAVFFPQDGHMPQLQCGGGPEEVKKVVIKVPV